MWMLWQYHSPTLVTDVETTFRQCCVNVVATLPPNIGDWHWDNAPRWRQHFGPVLVANIVPMSGSNIVLGCLRFRMTVTLKNWIFDVFATSASISTVEHSHLQPFLSNTTYHSKFSQEIHTALSECKLSIQERNLALVLNASFSFSKSVNQVF